MVLSGVESTFGNTTQGRTSQTSERALSQTKTQEAAAVSEILHRSAANLSTCASRVGVEAHFGSNVLVPDINNSRTVMVSTWIDSNPGPVLALHFKPGLAPMRMTLEVMPRAQPEPSPMTGEVLLIDGILEG